MNRDTILNKARERGFEVHHCTADHSIYTLMAENGLNLIVYPETEEFELTYCVDLVVRMGTGKIGSFMNDKHFLIFERKMNKYIGLLQEGDVW